MAWLKMIWNSTIVFWWIIVFVIIMALAICVYLVSWKKKKKQDGMQNGDKAFSLVEAVSKNIQNAITDVKVEKAIIKTKTEAKRAELEDIRRDPDANKRRERLAAILRKSL